MPKCLYILPFLLVAGYASADGLSPSIGGPRVYQEMFQLRSDGRFSVPTWREVAPDLAEMSVLAGCQSLGFDCGDDPGAVDPATRYIRRTIVSGVYRGTAAIVRVRQDRYYAKFTAPKGFTTCRAGIYSKAGSISDGATFAGSIQRSGSDGVSVYADLGDAPPEPRFIEFRLLILFVPKDSSPKPRCWPDQTILFLCRGHGDCRSSGAYPETDLR